MPKSPESLSIHFARQTLQAEGELEKEGYRLPGRPLHEMPKVPAHPSDLTDDDLMDLFAELVRWSDHVGGVLAMCEIDERTCEALFDMAFSIVLPTFAPTKREGSVTIAKSEAMQHPEVRDANDNRNVAYARRKLMQTIYANLERDAQLVSRELTRRTARYDNELRYGKYRP